MINLTLLLVCGSCSTQVPIKVFQYETTTKKFVPFFIPVDTERQKSNSKAKNIDKISVVSLLPNAKSNATLKSRHTINKFLFLFTGLPNQTK